MKIIILGVIFALISLIGFKIGGKFKEKEKFYAEFLKFLLNLSTQVSFFKTNLIEVANNFKTNNNNMQVFLQQFKDKLTENKNINLNNLSEDENREINDFVLRLGNTDCFSEENYLQKYNEIFKQKYNDSVALNLKYGVLYKKLGVLVAFFVCIVLI